MIDGLHADDDADILSVALRETAEASGVEPLHVKLLSDAIFDVDIHSIAAGAYAARHEHIDIRFLTEIDDKLPITVNDESHDIGWVAWHEVPRFNNNRSTYRMVEKMRQMRHITPALPSG
jgi:hypothetical protein